MQPRLDERRRVRSGDHCARGQGNAAGLGTTGDSGLALGPAAEQAPEGEMNAGVPKVQDIEGNSICVYQNPSSNLGGALLAGLVEAGSAGRVVGSAGAVLAAGCARGRTTDAAAGARLAEPTGVAGASGAGVEPAGGRSSTDTVDGTGALADTAIDEAGVL